MGFFTSKKRRKSTTESRSPTRPPPPRPAKAPHPSSSHRPRPQEHPPAQPPRQQPPLGQCWAHDQNPYGSAMASQSTACLPAPAGWTPPPQYPPGQAPPPYTNSHQRPCHPIVVNQYYLHTPPAPGALAAKKSLGALNKFGDSVANLTSDVVTDVIPQMYDDSLTAWQTYGCQVVNQTAAMVDQISSRLNHVMTMIDVEKVAGHERDLFTYHAPGQAQQAPPSAERAPVPKRRGDKNAKGQTAAVAAAVVSGGYFTKVDLYANSRLPRDLPPLKLYVSTWPLICAAANYSERVYAAPKGAEKDTHVSANWRGGTRAMVIKSVPMDDKSVIVFAIRGTATFMDWAVNFNMEPTSAAGFLDDPGNLCHGGFLSSARSMLKPVAARLRQLLADRPARSGYSLVITGHSAGGAVAALLYAHMHSASRAARSELSVLAGSFKRIHCVTFGAPPVSLLPLGKPEAAGLRKSVFLAFVNEGDPVARADKAYVRSLIELLAAPEPGKRPPESGKVIKKEKSRMALAKKTGSGEVGPTWRVPNCALSLAGRIVVLRTREARRGVADRWTVEERMGRGVVAVTASDGDVRGVVWGDPVCHVMRFYSRRVEALAVEAITARR